MADAVTLPVFSAAGDPAGTVPTPAAFAGRPHVHAMWAAVVKQLANGHVGTHSTKTKGEVSGGGKKPYKQKHTGRARQGSTRNPHWRHGGVAFGPTPHGYEQALPAKVRRLALRSVLAAKARAGEFVVLEGLTLAAPKTKLAAALLGKVAPRGGLVVVEAPDEGLSRATRNLTGFRVDTAAAVSPYDLLAARRVVVVRGALEPLAKRAGAGEPA